MKTEEEIKKELERLTKKLESEKQIISTMIDNGENIQHLSVNPIKTKVRINLLKWILEE